MRTSLLSSFAVTGLLFAGCSVTSTPAPPHERAQPASQTELDGPCAQTASRVPMPDRRSYIAPQCRYLSTTAIQRVNRSTSPFLVCHRTIRKDVGSRSC